MNKLCITFAGAVGSSKSPIANYLSGKLNLPVLNNDIIRTEVIEDLGSLNQDEYIKRRNERAKSILESGVSFIYDASVDREWEVAHKWLQDSGYRWFIISLDLSKDFLLKLYSSKGYDESKERLEQLFLDHQNFLDKFGPEVNLHITDENFKDRLNISYAAAKQFADNHPQ